MVYAMSIPHETQKLETAILASGCFWCTEAVFKIVKGVEEIDPGYTGGIIPNPSYEEVSSGKTGHVEAVQITFDPSVISFKEILEIFFTTHDPTTINRQGPDVGTQYNSIIFYRDETQKATATALIDELAKEGIWDNPIVTKVLPAKMFYKAETYHWDYYAKHPESAYCQQVIAPKIVKLQQKYYSKLKPVTYF
jgi:peptide-methionine (S)-S-oxide reductase